MLDIEAYKTKTAVAATFEKCLVSESLSVLHIEASGTPEKPPWMRSITARSASNYLP
jgi:hypothetical protein